ncbi:MAG TPA: hypothetical protein DEV93_00160 [Chloroflexi bacterium]|nr:hypothetical protein [Chloroflexota bacterium]
MKAQGLVDKAPLFAGLTHPDPIGLTATDARRIQQPTLLLSGERSAAPFGAIARRLAELIPNSEVRVIPNASHGMNFQNPVAVDTAILDFLERHSAA